MKINWLKLKNRLSTSLTVLKAIIALAIEAGIIIAVIHFKWYEKYPITTLIASNLVTMVIVYNVADTYEATSDKPKSYAHNSREHCKAAYSNVTTAYASSRPTTKNTTNTIGTH